MQRPHQILSGGSPASLVFVFPWDFVAATDRQDKHPQQRDDQASLDEPVSTAEHESGRLAPMQKRRSFVSVTKKPRSPKSSSSAVADSIAASTTYDRPFTVNSWLPPQELYNVMFQIQPITIIGFASTLANLARWMTANQKRLPTVKHVWTTSEVLAPNGADAIREAINCEPLSIYASNEFGFMGWQAEPEGPLQLESDRLYFEFLKPGSQEPAAVGAQSRMVVTDLLNDTTPLIRYDIEDVAKPCQSVTGDEREGRDDKASARISCPYTIEITELQGKEADLVCSCSGEPISTFLLLSTIRDNLPNAQYRLIALSPNEFILQYRPGVGFRAECLGEAVRALEQILGNEAVVDTHEAKSIERESSGKLRPLLNLDNVSLSKRRQIAKSVGIEHLIKWDQHQMALAIVNEELRLIIPIGQEKELEDDDELYRDIGLDSMRFMELILALERKLDREIDDEDLMDVELITMKDLFNFVERMIS